MTACSSRSMPPPAPPIVVAPKVDAPAKAPAEPAPPADRPKRLPHTFEPTSYAARLHVDPAQPEFSGTIEITGALSEPSQLIWLNAEDLRITSVTASRDGKQVPLTVRYALSYGRRNEASAPELALRSEEPLAAGTWTLTLTYTGTWNTRHAVGGFRETAQGLRLASNETNPKQDAYVFTQFEPDYARGVFPCFDEPDRKVPWQLTLDIPDGLVAASNSAIESETRSGGPYSTKTVRFARTLPLPSYLIAFAVGPFDIVDAGTSKHGTPIRILALRGEGKNVSAAATATPALLDKVEAWLDLTFPYPKLDLVAVPSTENWWLAMENAGLITFNTNALRDRWEEVVLHEIVHHWFGDFVTPAWWDDFWLNESFAYWLGGELSDSYYWTGDPGEVPIISAVTDPRAHHGGPYASVFKGAQLLALLDATVGTEPLKRALRGYLTAHAHGTVRNDDLRDALKPSLGTDFAGIFERYLSSPTAELDVELNCEGKSKRIEVKGFDTVGLLCVAYDHDGARADRCTKLAWGSATLELGTKRCPRWVLPKTLHHLTWTAQELEALRDRAWPMLTKNERMTVISVALANGTRGALRLSFIEKAAELDDPNLTKWITTYLYGLGPQIPASLRPQYDAWITKHFASRARAIGIAPTGVSIEKRRDAYELLALVLDAGDPTLRADALKLLPKLDDLDAASRVLVLRAAILDKPAFADELVSQLPKVNRTRMTDIAFALERTPDLLGLLQRHVAEIKLLQDVEKVRLLNQVCDGTKRADVEKLGRQIDPKWDQFSIRNFEWCVTERKALEPALRAFLTGAPVAPKASQANH
ncbi:MAG TPA: M1 family metallopeptidase [Kofleriaceae bacterium]|nr:M1 family metallopeptidase [Kofleriaceae bacterium]